MQSDQGLKRAVSIISYYYHIIIISIISYHTTGDGDEHG